MQAKTFGRFPTLGEMKEYYSRDDVLSFIYDECQMRNIDIAFRAKRTGIKPKSKDELIRIIEKDITDKIENAYRDIISPVDDARLNKHDYLSFHSQTSITKNGKLLGFDMIFEADAQGWRRSFDDLYGVIRLLDSYGVCYRIKYSGVRSLHFMIPFESFPPELNGESILSLRSQLQERLQRYFHKHCGMEKAHGGGVIRLAYSLNEDIGLVSLPITSDELSKFRPYEANIHNIKIDKPWHGEIPADAPKNMLNFLHDVYNDESEKAKGIIKVFNVNSENYKSIEYKDDLDILISSLRSDDQYKRVEVAWRLLQSARTLPFPVLSEFIVDENPDVRWYMTESLQKNLDENSVKLAGKMLWDEDQFVRISAIDALALSGEMALKTISESLSSEFSASIQSLHDIVYAIHKICPKNDPKALEALVDPIGKSIARMIQDKIADTRQWEMISYIRSIRGLCSQYNITETMLLRNAIKEIIPLLLKSFSALKGGYFRVRILRELHKNDAIALMAMREIAKSLNISGVKIPSNRMADNERLFLSQTIQESLSNMMEEEKINIIAIFWFNSGEKIRQVAGDMLVSMNNHIAVESIKKLLKSDFQGYRLSMAIRLLNRIDPLAVESLTEWQKSVQMQFSDESKSIAKEKSIDELIQMIESKSWHNRQLGTQALAQACKSDEDIDRLIGVFRSKNYKARVCATIALGAMPQNAKARLAILGAINESFWQVRREALRIYVRTGSTDIVDVLLRVLKRQDSAQVKILALKELKRFVSKENVLESIKEIQNDINQHRKVRLSAEKLLQKVK